MKKVAAISICLAAIAAGGIIGLCLAGGPGAFLPSSLNQNTASGEQNTGGQNANGQNADAGDTEDPEGNTPKQSIGNTITFNGQTYRYNSSLKNVLVIGVDTGEPFKSVYKPGDSGQCDFLLLLSIDEQAGTGKILEIHRNSMTEVDHFDEDGWYTYSQEDQICLQYGYSIGGQAGCRATVQTVSDLLYGVDIDDYFTIAACGIPELVDAFGGVDVTVSADYTDLDPSFTEGATVHLDGDLAETYIRSRDCTEFDSATDRMKRQTDFLCGLTSAIGQEGTGKLYDIYTEYNEKYLITDMTAENMKTFGEVSYDTADILTVPGQTIMGDDGYEEYHVDEEALQQLVVENYYTPVETKN